MTINKKKSGRPRFDGGVQKRRNITLSDRIARKAEVLGGGNISAGIRKAIESVDIDTLGFGDKK